jgi:hypothetical protein
MNVSEILKLLATLSIGLDEPQDTDVIVFMQYINLCYFEVLQETIAQNPFVQTSNDKLDCNSGILDATADPIFIPISVYDIARNSRLSAAAFDEIDKTDPGLTSTGIPEKWYQRNGVINVYPIATSLVADGGGFGVKYIKNPSPLTPQSTSSDILIPTMYQQIIAFGASYYILQSETGFKDQTKMMFAEKKWEEGKKKLFSYMKNASGKKTYSTYSVV